MQTKTYNEIATDYSLWGEYVDPLNTMSETEFDALTIDARIAIMVECFGPEDFEDEDTE